MHDSRVRRGNTHGAKPSLGATSASGTVLKTMQHSTRRRTAIDPFKSKAKQVYRKLHTSHTVGLLLTGQSVTERTALYDRIYAQMRIWT